MIEFDGMMLAMMDEAGYNGLNRDHISKISASLMGVSNITESDVRACCRSLGIDPNNLSSTDISDILFEVNGRR